MDTLLSLRLCTAEYDPVRATSFVSLPEWVAKRGACINVQNHSDNRCFLYSVLAHYHHASVKVRERHLPSAYTPFQWELDMVGIGYPTNVDNDLARFERQNPGAVNVFSLRKNKKIKPLRISTKKGDHSPPLLLFCHI